MRIRGKRQDPLFLSSDLYFNQVQPQVHSVGSSQPSDRSIEVGSNGRDLSDHINNDVLTKEEIKRNKEDCHNISKNIDLGLLDCKQTASPQDDLKMRKTKKKGLEQRGSSSTSSNNVQRKKEEEEEEEAAQEIVGLMDDHVGVVTASGKGKKKARGDGVLMEGSRCSRVNGRGWRCCQPTLVGYSLCEHHLGKGRVRGGTDVKGQKGNFDKKKKKMKKKKKRKSFGHDDDDDDYDEDEDEDDVGMKKRIKLGMVKARSISSLLGETRNDVVVALSDDDYDGDK